MPGRNQLVVPQARQALQQLKMEAAQEQNVQIPQDGYYGMMTARDTGSLGGYITKRLVQIAESQMSGGQAGAAGAGFTSGTFMSGGQGGQSR